MIKLMQFLKGMLTTALLAVADGAFADDVDFVMKNKTGYPIKETCEPAPFETERP